jgi:hypothetical protein
MLQGIGITVVDTVIPSPGIVDQLVWHGQLAWLQGVADDANGIDRDNAANLQLLQCLQVGPVVDAMRRDLQVVTVPRDQVDEPLSIV